MGPACLLVYMECFGSYFLVKAAKGIPPFSKELATTLFVCVLIYI